MKSNKSQFDWKKELTINLRGGVWVGLFTLIMLAACVDVLFIRGGDVPEGIRWLYGTVLGAFATSKTVSKFVNGKNGKEVDED